MPADDSLSEFAKMAAGAANAIRTTTFKQNRDEDPTLEVLMDWRAKHPKCGPSVWRKDGDPEAVITVDGRCDLCKRTDEMISKLRP